MLINTSTEHVRKGPPRPDQADNCPYLWTWPFHEAPSHSWHYKRHLQEEVQA